MLPTFKTTNNVNDFSNMTKKEKRKAISNLPSLSLDPDDVFQACNIDNLDVPQHSRATVKIEQTEYDSTNQEGSQQKRRKLVSQQSNSTNTSSTTVSSSTNSLPRTIQVQSDRGVEQHGAAHPSSLLPGLASTVDMSLTELNDDSMVTMLKKEIKKHVFHIWKFFQPEFQGKFNRDEKTMCGYLMKKSGFHGGEAWWSAAQNLVTKTLTDCRNNCIKNMQMKFKGKYSTAQTTLLIQNANH